MNPTELQRSVALERVIALCLTDAGGPPDLAPQLIALAKQHGLSDRLKDWIMFHQGVHWSTRQFHVWCLVYWQKRSQTVRESRGK